MPKIATPKLSKKKEEALASSEVLNKFASLSDSYKDSDNTSILVTEDYEEKKFPTESIVLNEVLRLDGMPFGGRVVHIHGKEHGGKSTLCYSIVRSYQKYQNAPAVIFDFEHTTTFEYLKALGVNTRPTHLALFKETDIESCIKKAIEYMEAGCKLFVFDSIPKMKHKVDKKDIKSGQAFKASVGRHARAMVEFFDLICPYAMKHDCLLLMVNQIRARIDGSQEAAMAQKYPSYTNLPYVLPGGNSVRFVPSLMIEVNPSKALKGATDDPFLMEPEPETNSGKKVKATRVKVRILKNKVTMGSYREYHLYLRTGKGLDDWMSVRELARFYGLIKNRGAKYIVGNADDPIIVYDNKEAAIRDLVLDQNIEVLSRLRELLVTVIREDDSGSFDAEITEGERMLTGEIDSPEISAAIDEASGVDEFAEFAPDEDDDL